MKKIHTKEAVIGCPACGGRMSVVLGWPRWFRRYGPPIVLRTIEECPTGCGVGESPERRAVAVVETRRFGRWKPLPETVTAFTKDYRTEVWAAALATYWYKSVKLRAI